MKDIYLVQHYKCGNGDWNWDTTHVVHSVEKARKKADKVHSKALKELDNMADRSRALFSASVRIVLVIHNWI